MSAALSQIPRRRLVGDALSLYAVQGLNYLLPLLMLPYLLRALGPHGYGSIIFAQSLIGYAAIVTEFGFNFTAARDVSVARSEPRTVARIYWTTMAAKLLLLCASGCVVGVVIAATPAFRADWQIFAASGLILVGNVAFPQWYFQGLERLREVALVQAISKCVVAGGVIAFVSSPDDIFAAAILLSSPQLAGALTALALGRPLAPASFYLPTSTDIRQALAGSWHMFTASIATTLYLHTNTFVLGLMAGEKAVALYSLGGRVIAAIQGLAGPIIQAVFPRASLLFAEQRAQAWVLLKRVAWVLLPAIGGASALLAVLAPQVASLLGGSAYSDASSVVRIMAVVPLLVTTAAVLAQVVIVNVGLTRYLARIYLAAGIVNLVLLPPLIWKFAANGAAIALVVAETLGPILMIVLLYRRRKELR